MVQDVSRCTLIMETLGRGGGHAHPCGFVVDKVVLGHVFLWVLLFFPVSFHCSYPPLMPHNLSSWRNMKTRTEAKNELVRLMCRVTYSPLKDRSGKIWMGNCGLGMGYHYQTEFMHHSYWFSLNPHPLILVSLISSVQSFFLCPNNGSSRSLQNTCTYLPYSLVSHLRGQ